MRITWFGTASVRLESAEKRILFDPYLRAYGDAEEKLLKAYQKDDTIMITHGHCDHIADMHSIYKNRQDIDIYATKTPLQSLVRDGMQTSVMHEICSKDTLQIYGFSITVYQGEHIRFDARLIIRKLFTFRSYRYIGRMIQLLRLCYRYRENKEIVFYEVVAEGKRIQLMGSAALAKDVVYPTGADVLVLAYQGRSDMEQYASKLIERLHPKAVMPIHFDDAFPPMSEEVNMVPFLNMMQKQFSDIKVMFPQVDVAYEI